MRLLILVCLFASGCIPDEVKRPNTYNGCMAACGNGHRCFLSGQMGGGYDVTGACREQRFCFAGCQTEFGIDERK